MRRTRKPSEFEKRIEASLRADARAGGLCASDARRKVAADNTAYEAALKRWLKGK